uniref:Intraflagellar transport protein 57 homolog n=1 Tax=Propithecus coquereli TaxID=379532 RepID=A0A2K6G6P9_PROCO
CLVTPSGLEDGVPRSRGEGAGEVIVERGPGAAYHMFVVMEDLVEKLKLLRYEEELLRKNNLKPPSRHYFSAVLKIFLLISPIVYCPGIMFSNDSPSVLGVIFLLFHAVPWHSLQKDHG